MWLITPTGFFSVVCKPGDMKAGTLTIRARVQLDLETLREQYLPSLGPTTKNAGTDYPYRAKAKRSEVASALAQMIQQLNYDNFKNEVAEKQGPDRAEAYHEVWKLLYDLEKTMANTSKLQQKSNRTASSAGQKTNAYGGVVLDEMKRVLLRRPRGDFDGYVWTFPKGRAKPRETPGLAALREVKEETGYDATIIEELPGSFAGGTSVTRYFLMTPIGSPTTFDKETSAIKWATLDEAAKLIELTTNRAGKIRDLSVLEAVRLDVDDTTPAHKRDLSALFRSEPQQWGLRGDPFLWRHMKQTFKNTSFPETEDQFLILLEQTFHELTSHRLPNREAVDDSSVFVEKYAHGGMSSGHISLRFWRDTAIPLLCSRYRKSRR
jgi:8-oxo-dGTP pyrophosphatase MutT (NUDIX family)